MSVTTNQPAVPLHLDDPGHDGISPSLHPSVPLSVLPSLSLPLPPLSSLFLEMLLVMKSNYCDI